MAANQQPTIAQSGRETQLARYWAAAVDVTSIRLVSVSADGDRAAAPLTGRSVGGDELWIAEHWTVREGKLWRMMNFYYDTTPLVGDRTHR
jgi:hypothetical protein